MHRHLLEVVVWSNNNAYENLLENLENVDTLYTDDVDAGKIGSCWKNQSITEALKAGSCVHLGIQDEIL